MFFFFKQARCFFVLGLMIWVTGALGACSGSSSSSDSSSSSSRPSDEVEGECSEPGRVVDVDEASSSPGACRDPQAGHYVNDEGEEVACSPIAGGTFLPNEGPLSEDACPFECLDGYNKAGRSCVCSEPGRVVDVNKASSSPGACRDPQTGHYVNNAGQEVACSPIAGSTFLPNEGPLSEDACPFECLDGYNGQLGRLCVCPEPGRVVDVDRASSSPGACRDPQTGHYVNNAGQEVACSPLARTTFLPNKGPLFRDACPFKCSAGYHNKLPKSCEVPPTGRYVNEMENFKNVEKSKEPPLR